MNSTVMTSPVHTLAALYHFLSEFRLEYFDWPTIQYWFSYFGVTAQIDQPLDTDSEEVKRHKRNHLRVCHYDCHKNPEKILVCFTRSHVPRGINVGLEEETDEAEEAQPPIDRKTFKFRLIYRAVIPYNNYYIVYTGVDNSNKEGQMRANCHSRGSADVTTYGLFQRNYNVRTSYVQGLHYFHHPHPDLQFMTPFDIEGTWILAHVFGKILNVNMEFEKPKNKDQDNSRPQEFGVKPFLLLNSRVNLTTSQPEVTERLLMQAFRILFKENMQLIYNPNHDQFNLNFQGHSKKMSRVV